MSLEYIISSETYKCTCITFNRSYINIKLYAYLKYTLWVVTDLRVFFFLQTSKTKQKTAKMIGNTYILFLLGLIGANKSDVLVILGKRLWSYNTNRY